MKNPTSMLYRLAKIKYHNLRAYFWKPETIEQDVLCDRLERYGVPILTLNKILDSEFPETAGRFPELFREIPDLAQLVSNRLYQAIKQTQSLPENITCDERTARIREYVAERVAEDLSMKPEIFRKIFNCYEKA